MKKSYKNLQLDIDSIELKLNCYDEIAPFFDEIMGMDFLDITFDLTYKILQRVMI